jgi:hypothetical protein
MDFSENDLIFNICDRKGYRKFIHTIINKNKIDDKIINGSILIKTIITSIQTCGNKYHHNSCTHVYKYEKYFEFPTEIKTKSKNQFNKIFEIENLTIQPEILNIHETIVKENIC